MRKTKIVCTLGPASMRRETIAALIRAGMDVARLNTSHGDPEQHSGAINLVREVSAEEGRPIGILMDLGGPKLRTGRNKGHEPIELKPGLEVSLVPDDVPGTAETISIGYPRLLEDVRANDTVLLNDGAIELKVDRVEADALHCRVIYGGPLGEQKGVSFPMTTLTTPAITDHDREYIKLGVKEEVDYFGLSFVREAADIVAARDIIAGLGAETPVIAKIERRQAVANLESILEEADGAMVARGDLGVELPPEDVPVQQHRIITASGREMIPVITATQMLESMMQSTRPTRAESSDVAHAVWDLSDALMLSGETAIGQYPVEAVAMMDRIIRRAEEAFPTEQEMLPRSGEDDHSYVVALATRQIIESDANMRGVVCFTRSGYTALLLSKVHQPAPIFAITPSEAVCRRLTLARSVIPILAPVVSSTEEVLDTVDRVLVEGHYLSVGDEVVVVASMPVDAASTTNFL
ncbi:pyruvate kinase [bacterium]|nr:pyruvate kinase [bacterium]